MSDEWVPEVGDIVSAEFYDVVKQEPYEEIVEVVYVCSHYVRVRWDNGFTLPLSHDLRNLKPVHL